MFPYYFFPRMYCMDDLFCMSHGIFNYAAIEQARRKNRRAKAFKWRVQ